MNGIKLDCIKIYKMTICSRIIELPAIVLNRLKIRGIPSTIFDFETRN